jgi:hypothetical protein
VKTLTVEGVDHFGVLAPITRLLATKINADSGSRSNIAISQPNSPPPSKRGRRD